MHIFARRFLWGSMLLALLSVAFLISFNTASAHTTTANSSSSFVSRAVQKISPVGTWHSTVNFIAGGRAGLQEQVDFTFTSDGKVSSVASTISGAGAWTQTSAVSFSFQFDEKIYVNGQFIGTVHVTNDAIFTDDGNGFIAYSQSTVTDPSGNVTPGENIAITTATRA